MISMSQHIHNLMGESMKGLRDLVDVDCIVGKPIVTASHGFGIRLQCHHPWQGRSWFPS